MTASLELEDRLRAGLRAAAEAVPPAPDTLPTPGEQVVRLRPSASTGTALFRRRRAVVALATAAALAAVAGTVVVLTGEDDQVGSPADVAADSDQPTTTTPPPHELRIVNGMVPGQAVASDGKLTTYGPDGQPTGTIDLAPLGTLQTASSDLEGGWVVCGGVAKTYEELNPDDPDGTAAQEAEAALDDAQEDAGAPATTVPATVAQQRLAELEAGTALADAQEAAGSAATTVPTTGAGGVMTDEPVPDVETTGQPSGGVVDVLTWFPAGRDPVELDGNVPFPGCMEGSIQVVDSPDGPVALRGGLSMDPGSDTPLLEGIVLATGERRDYQVPDLAGLPWRWAVTTGKALTDIDGVGLQLWDLDTSEEIPIAAIDPGDISHLALSHDGKTAAVLVGPISGPVDAIVYDLASGAEIFRKSFDMSAEGDEMSYDGATLAVGNFYDGYGPVAVIDLASGAEHTIDAHGIVL